MKKQTQTEQVIEAMKSEGGFATLRRLNEIVDFSNWKSKTPEASVRRIVQESPLIFKIQPGLWALEEYRNTVLAKFKLKIGNSSSEEKFTHGYYQGLLVEIGRLKNFFTYIPAQDKRRLFLGQELREIVDTTDIPQFTYDNLLRKAKTVDVVWFNERQMPSHFYEVEHSTDIKNSLSKFYELQDFYSNFYIVADGRREAEYNDKISVSMFKDIAQRVHFLDYSKIVKAYTHLKQISELDW